MPCCVASSRLTVELYRYGLSGKQCALIEDVGAPEVLDLAEELRRICIKNSAVSLAAPQVGVYLQLAVLMRPGGKVETLINPRIVNLGARDLLETETCLAVPGAAPRVWRSEIVQLRSDPDSGQIRTYKGALARAALHEIDHLNGVYFLDRCQIPGRKAALQAYAQWLKNNR